MDGKLWGPLLERVEPVRDGLFRDDDQVEALDGELDEGGDAADDLPFACAALAGAASATSGVHFARVAIYALH